VNHFDPKLWLRTLLLPISTIWSKQAQLVTRRWGRDGSSRAFDDSGNGCELDQQLDFSPAQVHLTSETVAKYLESIE
jgi:hypothetical protein